MALKGERLSSEFSPDGTLISASAAPHRGKQKKKKKKTIRAVQNNLQISAIRIFRQQTEKRKSFYKKTKDLLLVKMEREH